MPSRRARGERGAALVEAAIMLPIVIVLIFGSIEFGFTFNEQGTTRNSTRSAARAISTVPKADNVSMGGNFEDAAIDALETSLSNLINGEPQFALIYDATGGIEPTACPPADCVRYDSWDAATERFTAGPIGNEWLPSERNACVAGTDKVGVYVEVLHEWITGLPFVPGLGDDVTMSSRTVMALEPHSGPDCGGT